MIKKWILKYIRKQGGDPQFMADIQLACHEATQSVFSDQTVPGRIYEVFEYCAAAIPKVVPKVVIDDPAWRKFIADGIQKTVRKQLQLPT